MLVPLVASLGTSIQCDPSGSLKDGARRLNAQTQSDAPLLNVPKSDLSLSCRFIAFPAFRLLKKMKGGDALNPALLCQRCLLAPYMSRRIRNRRDARLMKEQFMDPYLKGAYDFMRHNRSH
jgi:hypothetical protein